MSSELNISAPREHRTETNYSNYNPKNFGDDNGATGASLAAVQPQGIFGFPDQRNV